MNKRVLIGITGASGSIYAERLIHVLKEVIPRIYIVISDAGEQVARTELVKKNQGFSLLKFLDGEISDKDKTVIRRFSNSDLFSPIASGSASPTHTVIVPCSMGTLARVANGISSNLLERSIDVSLKEQDKIIIVPRETPVSQIHLENMLKLSKMGVSIIPAMPAFYNKPKSVDDMVDFIVARILKALDIEENQLLKVWNKKMI